MHIYILMYIFIATFFFILFNLLLKKIRRSIGLETNQDLLIFIYYMFIHIFFTHDKKYIITGINPTNCIVLYSSFWSVGALLHSIENMDVLINTSDIVVDEWRVGRITNGLLNHYYSIYDDWLIAPEQHRYNNRTDFIVQKVDSNGDFYDHIFVEVKKPLGSTSYTIKEGVMWQVNRSASFNSSQRQEMFAIIHTGNYISFFESYDFEIENGYEGLKILNLTNLTENELNALHVDFEWDSEGKVVAHKWNLNKPQHRTYIDDLFKYMAKNLPTRLS